MIQLALTMKKTAQFLGEIKLELTKVKWLTKDETIKLTAMVLITAGILGGFVGGFDYLFTKILSIVFI